MRTGFMRIRKDSVLSLVIDKKYSLYLQMVPTISGDLEMKETCKSALMLLFQTCSFAV
jgi:hypothetical protein